MSVRESRFEGAVSRKGGRGDSESNELISSAAGRSCLISALCENKALG